MEFESVQSCANRLNVNIRTVQKWAKEGKIVGAKKVGRDWMIPLNSDVDKEANVKEVFNSNEVSLLNANYPLGKFKENILQIADTDIKNLQLAEYYFYSGKCDIASAMAEPYLDHENLKYRYLASMICVFANLSGGHSHLVRYCQEITKSDLYDELMVDGNIEAKAMAVFTASSIAILLRLPIEGKPLLSKYIKYLPEGMKLFSCYVLAHKAYVENNYDLSYGIAKTALSLHGDKYVLPSIYLHVICASSLVNLMRVKEAEEQLMQAFALLKEDGFYEILGESYSLLHGLCERCFKNEYPEVYMDIISITKRFGAGWIKIHNEGTNNNVTTLLNSVEFTVAMLYNRGWRAKEIAHHLNISERTVKKYLSIIYEKLNITSRKELNSFLLQ